MKLADRLASLKPEDADKYLAQVWKDFAGTEAFDAVQYLLGAVTNEAEVGVFNPIALSEARAYFAGQLALCKRLTLSITSILNFKPDPADYDKAFEVLEGGEDVPADDGQLV